MEQEPIVHECENRLTLNISTNEVLAQTMLWSWVEGIMISVMLPVITTVGSLFNLSFLFVVLRIPAMHTVTNAYLVNIALADLILLTWTGGTYLSVYLDTPVRNDVLWGSPIGCVIIFAVGYFGYFASLLLVTFVTAERYYVICRPLLHRMISGKKHTIQMITASWFTAVVLVSLVIPGLTGTREVCVIWPDDERYDNFPMLVQYCVPTNAKVQILSETTLTLPFFIILPINLFMYANIILTLSRRSGAFADERMTAGVTRARNQVARLLIVNGTVFLLCQAPYRAISIHYITKAATGGEEILSPTVYGITLIVSRLLFLINSSVNPLVYLATNSFYRQSFRDAFCCQKLRKSKNFGIKLSVTSVETSFSAK